MIGYTRAKRGKNKTSLILAYSHQMRTALTILRGYLSLAQNGEFTIGPDTTAKLLSEIDTLTGSVEGLLVILRLYSQTNHALRNAVKRRYPYVAGTKQVYSFDSYNERKGATVNGAKPRQRRNGRLQAKNPIQNVN